MRQFIIAAALALGLVALWAAIVPLTAEPAPAQTVANSPALAKALFLCRGPHGIDRTCAAALAAALLPESSGEADRTCHIDHQSLASLARHD
jgi:hypothetical protein